MNATGTKRVILTGTTTDPQLYKHERRLVELLRNEIPGVHLSVHTNGLLALKKRAEFDLYDTATISINSFNAETFRTIHGVKDMPNIKALVEDTRPSIKLSCILTPHNIDEVPSYLERAAQLGVKRVALRHLHDVASGPLLLPTPAPLNQLEPIRTHADNPVYDVHGVEVTHWIFDKTDMASINLFADGTLSEDYLLDQAPGASPVRAME